ncbi:MAG TPA: sulfatase-like hydrolase/transferase [Pirellulales bacterium]|nr:sulfatase-like hydrolase/transferase [Pirellulales bacterium]
MQKRCGFLTICLLMTLTASAPAASRPNVVLVLADDLGWGDLACFGSPEVKTPHLDRFASQGLRLTSCYAAAANCSPARAGLMTGRTPYRVGVYTAIPMLSPMHLRAEEITIARLLASAGYQTCHVGKWHLNGMFNLPGQPQPSDHGFGHWFSTQNNCLPNHLNPYNFVRDSIPMGPIEGYASSIVVDEAVRWLRDDRAPEQPFFMYLCFHEPHEPIQTAPKFASLYDFPDDPSRVAHHGNISQMDDAFGRLMQALDDLRLAENTLVWFTSDNGPERTKWHNTGSTGGLREYKGNVYEGGIRVPGMIRWPGHTPAGGTSDTPVCGTDFLPTVCAVTGIEPPRDRKIDGENVRPLLDGQTFDRRRPLYWQFNFAHSEPCVAMRDGDWKVVARLSEAPQRTGSVTAEANRMLKEARLKSYELYNLANDRGETTDLASREPQRLDTIVAKLEPQFADVQREAPVWPEWQDPGYERQRINWPDYLAKPLKKAK